MWRPIPWKNDSSIRCSYTEAIWNSEDESEDSLFDIKQAMMPTELFVGLTGFLLAFGLVCSSASHGALDDHECVRHFDEHHEKS